MNKSGLFESLLMILLGSAMIVAGIIGMNNKDYIFHPGGPRQEPPSMIILLDAFMVIFTV